MHARGGLFRNALNGLGHPGEVALRLFLELLLEQREENLFFLRLRLVEEGGVAILGAQAKMHVHRGVAAVVEDHVGKQIFTRFCAMPVEHLRGVVPVILQALALDGEHRHAGGCDCGGGVVLRRIDVARNPAHVGAERDQRLNQHAGLNGHVQGARDARAFQRLLRAVFLAGRHQARHFGLGQRQLLAAEFGKADVGDDIVDEVGLLGGGGGHFDFPNG